MRRAVTDNESHYISINIFSVSNQMLNALPGLLQFIKHIVE